MISTNNNSLSYHRLQSDLLLLSQDAKQVIAEHSTQMVIFDEPEAIITAIDDVVASISQSFAGRK